MESRAIEQEVLYGNHFFKKAKRFVLTVLLLRESIEPEIISRIVGVSKRQIYNYQKTYETGGITAIVADTRYRLVSELESYKDIIKADITTHPVATASERILSLTGIKRSSTQVRTFMHRLGLKPLKSASIPAKANPVAQTVFLGTNLEPRIQEAVEGHRTLLFMDAAHFVWQLYIGL